VGFAATVNFRLRQILGPTAEFQAATYLGDLEIWPWGIAGFGEYPGGLKKRAPVVARERLLRADEQLKNMWKSQMAC